MISIAALMMTGCRDGLPEVPEPGEIVVDHEVDSSEEDDFDDAESIAAVYRDIYDEAVETNTLGSLETMRRIVVRLGSHISQAILPLSDDRNVIIVIISSIALGGRGSEGNAEATMQIRTLTNMR